MFIIIWQIEHMQKMIEIVVFVPYKSIETLEQVMKCLPQG